MQFYKKDRFKFFFINNTICNKLNLKIKVFYKTILCKKIKFIIVYLKSLNKIKIKKDNK